MNADSIDRVAAKIKNYGPYGICLASFLMGISAYELGGRDDIPATILRWTGAVLCLWAVTALILWHFLKWPPWFVDIKPKRRK
jgi:hypothetical protein